ncbi:MAG TPA: hypothetical protein VIT45_00150 [Allosphingosinicella sp.]
MRILILPALALALSGCIAQTALDVVTLPVKIASAGVDAATVSQSEADEKRGRAMRKHEECLGKEARKADKQGREPNPEACPEPGEKRRS